MPSGKARDFDDTWRKEDLEKSIKDSRRSHKDGERRHRDNDDKRLRRKDDEDRRHRDKDTGDSDRKHRSSRHRDEEDGERRHRKHKEENGENKDDKKDSRHHKDDETEEEKRRRKERERGHREEEGERKHRGEEDRERRHRSDRDRDDRRNKDDDEERRRRHEEKRRTEKEREREEKERERQLENERQREKERERQREIEKQREREKRKGSEREREKTKERKREPEPEVEEKAEEQEEDGIGDYEDDFEDYDDDFEDDEEDEKLPPPTSKTQAPKSRTEIDEVKAAMDEENDRLLRESKPRAGGDDSDDSFEAHRPSRRRHDDEEDSRKSWGRPTIAHRSFINFTSAQQRHLSSQVASKARRRALDLMQNIELDIARFDLFDMPPVSEYELYMRTFGGSNTKQAYVQTNEDNMDRDIQTEEVESTEKWSQHPQESLDCVGGPDDDKKKEEDSVKPIDQVKLGRFLQFAAHTMLVLLEEDRAFAASLSGIQGGPQQQSDLCLSQAFSQLNTSKVEALKGRHVVHSCFSPSQSQMLLTLHSQPDTASSGVLCVWNVIEPEKPQKLLLTESRPGCCCFSPIKAHLAFAGMHDGSLAVWDLRETSALHTTVKGLTLRYPTYSTAGVLHYDNHLSPVIAVQPIVTQAEGEGSSGSSEHGGDNLNFQLISLEENCTINLWVVADIGHPDLAGLQSDLGLNPGGRVKLIKSSTISLQNPLRDRRLRSTMHAHSLGLLPSNNSHFYVTTNVGCVCHGVRYGGKASPSVYWTEQTESLATITSVDFSPFQIPVFLTGSADGSVRLYRTELDQAIVTWPDATQGNPVTCVRWCRSRPSVFFVLDASATVHIWDLLMNDAVPMKQEQIASKRVTSFELSNDHSATGLGMPGRKPQIVVSLEDGTTEIHTVKQEFSAFMSEELQRFNNLLLSYS